LSAGRRRAAWGAGAVAVAVALSVSIAAFITSFRTGLEEWTEQSLRADLSVRPLSGSNGLPVGRLDPDVLRAVRATLPDAGIDPFYGERAAFAGERVTIGGAALGVAADNGALVMLDGSDPSAALRAALEQHGALVNEAGALRFGWKTGDVIALDVRGRAVERRIAGVYRDYSDSLGVVVVDESDFLSWYPDARPATIGVHVAKGADARAVREELLAALAPRFQVDVLENERVRANVLAVFDRTFTITRALQGVAAIVAVIAVLSVLYALVSERRSDLGLMLAIGASARQVALVVCFQAGLLGLVGAAGGILAGTAIGLLIVKVVNLQSFGWTLAFVPPFGAALSTLALVAVACMVAALLPARAAVSMRPAAALREE
jgi:putative ABC transport system permease protein